MFVLHPDGAILLLKTIETENGTNWICTLLKLTSLNYLQTQICLLTGTESSCALHIIRYPHGDSSQGCSTTRAASKRAYNP
jgi:hypothetical protein